MPNMTCSSLLKFNSELVPTGAIDCYTCGGYLPKHLVAAGLEAQQPASRCRPHHPAAVNSTGASNHLDVDFGCILDASLDFYTAQRSGPSPVNSTGPFKWRAPTLLKDTAPNGAPLVGGWFDAGDTCKYLLPTAFTVSNLAW
jgi:hypothetical protein